MPNRYHNTEIWEQDWFIDLSPDYKLLYLFIKDKCDHSGIWRVNKRRYERDVLNGKIGLLDDFLHYVNRDLEDEEQKRIIVLDKHKWLLTEFIPQQCGPCFRPEIGAHRGALRLLVNNGILPRQIPNFDWGVFQNFDLQELMKLVYGNTMYKLSIQTNKSTHTIIEKEIEIEIEKEIERVIRDIGGVGGKEKEIMLKKVKEMLIPEMIITFKTFHPNYYVERQDDFPACLKIAYKIAEHKKIKKALVVDEEKNTILLFWKDIVAFTSKDEYYSNLTISVILKQFAKIIQKLNNQKTDYGKRNKNNSGGFEVGGQDPETKF